MKNLRILPIEESVDSLQKLWVPEKLSKNLSSYFNKCVLINRTDSTFSINLVYPKVNLNSSLCSIDGSVLYCEKLSDDQIPIYDLSSFSNEININKITSLKKVKKVNNILLSIVFRDVFQLFKWKPSSSKLKNLVKSILRLYIFTGNSVVLLKNLKFSELSIHSIIIHKTGLEHNRAFVTSANCNVEFHKLFSQLSYSQLIQSNPCQEIGGLQRQFQFISRIIEAHKNFRLNHNSKVNIKLPNQILLIGAPGCGKTVLTHAIAAKSRSIILTLKGAELLNSSPGETEKILRNKFEEARLLLEENEYGVCILLIKQIECLASKRHSGTAPHILRCTSQLLNLLDSVNHMPGLVIIAATEKAYDLDPALRRSGRLETEVYIGVPSEKERALIVSVLLKDLSCDNYDSFCKKVAAVTPGFYGADLALVTKMFQIQLIKNPKISENESEIVEMMIKCASQHQPSALKSGLGVIMTEPLQMSNLGGLQSIKQILKTYIEWPLKYPEKFHKFNIPPPKGVLLYGPPGCAKTSLARALASVTNTSFFSVSAAELYSPYVGTTEKSIVELFHRARIGAPSIVFIDEIDALVGKRGDTNEGVHERVLSAFLTEMDGVGVHVDALSLKSESSQFLNNVSVVVIGATNRPDKLDAALLRPGRLNKLIYVPPPNAEERLSILTTVVGKVPVASDVDLEYFAKLTEFYSGADLVNLVREAGLCALTEDGMMVDQIKQKHFVTASSSVHPSLSLDQIRFYSNFSFNN